MTVLVLLEFGGRYESFELVHCYHAAGFRVLVLVASGLPKLIQKNKMATLGCLCNVCDLRWFLVEQNVCLRIVFVEFHNFSNRHGLTQINRKGAVEPLEAQESGLEPMARGILSA